MQIDVYTDGSATIATKPGGYGWVMVVDGEKRHEGSGYMESVSNNDEELEAAIQGLKFAQGFIALAKLADRHKVTLVSDSQLVLGWIRGQYQFRQLNKMAKYKELTLLVQLMDVQTRWVEGHTGDEHNERCDALANAARKQLEKEEDKIEAIKNGETVIGTKKTGVACIWYKNKLKVIDLDTNVVEDYDREIHGSRGSLLEIRGDKLI